MSYATKRQHKKKTSIHFQLSKQRAIRPKTLKLQVFLGITNKMLFLPRNECEMQSTLPLKVINSTIESRTHIDTWARATLWEKR